MPTSAFEHESLVSDPIHGYLTFTAARGGAPAEQTLIDHPWVQRMRRIHQLQSAWWVYPSAEHTRFQHILGAMQVASRAAERLYPSLREVCGSEVPTQPYVESLLRIAALLHDVGHGPYGHFFDDQFLDRYHLTHEDIGRHIIRTELAEIIQGIRANPHGRLTDREVLDADQIAYLIKRPARGGENEPARPRWLQMLRALFSGIYTVDNLDFVLRDSYMAGYNLRAVDLERLLHYTFFSEHGLTLHERGMSALLRFLEVRGELFRTLYFHRTVRAIDLAMADIFRSTIELLMPGNPLDHLDRYRELTEWSLLVDVGRWQDDADPHKRDLGKAWQAILTRQVHWKMACERTIPFEQGEPELASIFTDPALVEKRVRSQLSAPLRDWPFRADVARHYHRPIRSSSIGQNFLYEPARQQIRPLVEHPLLARLPTSFSVCRLYVHDHQHDSDLAGALDRLLKGTGDDKTNM